RSKLWLVQTPQVFKTSDLVRAYDRMMSTDNIGNITDDAMVMEHYGDLPVHMTEGDYLNIKVRVWNAICSGKEPRPFLQKENGYRLGIRFFCNYSAA
ncbi:MAG: 2-C-methyl-D-erythritol 4-phosphate cytidylyltransferase, partial [Clostridia bacterium]|nr:2-C-methyl-D-erythritol 4-phosphate cytidylyltransferase [Clostridia bacterium]